MKYKYKLSNLDCANCANKIECKLNNDENIEKATVNFSKMTVSVLTNVSDTKKYITKIINSVEPEVSVLEMNEEKKESSLVFSIIRLILGIIFALIGIFIFKNKYLIIISYILLLYKTFINSIKLLIKSKTINENLLVTISCIGAYFTDNIHEGLMVIVLYEIGKILEQIAVNNSRKSISELMDIKPEYANLKKDDKIILVNPDSVKIGDIIVVKQGEKIPLDGVVIKGSAFLNVSALTGESKLKKVKKDDLVLSGSINTKGLIEIKVTEEYSDSTVYKILELVETATDRKAKTETFVSKAAKIYTPIIIILALMLLIILPLIFKVSIDDALYRALVFLVVSCPCAIAISVPLSYFTGIGASSKKGILVKGSDYLDTLSKVNKIIFDKTGTITTGTFSDYKLNILSKNYSKEEAIKYLVSGELLSNHPIAKSIVNIFGKDKTVLLDDFEEISGIGIRYMSDKKEIKIGSYKMADIKDKNGLIYLIIDNELVASLELLDGIKKEAKETISTLKKMNIKTKMFTGDDKEVALNIADKVKIDEVSYSLLPGDKYNLLEQEIKNSDYKIAFVGDGINDAPSLALSDVGISMGGIGSASAVEASDIVIMNDDLSKIIDAINISKMTNHIIKQNLIFAITVKILVLILSSFGIASMWQAVFADTGVTLLTILNTTRILKKTK